MENKTTEKQEAIAFSIENSLPEAIADFIRGAMPGKHENTWILKLDRLHQVAAL